MTLGVIIFLRASVCYSLSRRFTRGTISPPANLVLYAALYTPNKSLPMCPGENKDLDTNISSTHLARNWSHTPTRIFQVMDRVCHQARRAKIPIIVSNGSARTCDWKFAAIIKTQPVLF